MRLAPNSQVSDGAQAALARQPDLALREVARGVAEHARRPAELARDDLHRARDLLARLPRRELGQHRVRERVRLEAHEALALLGAQLVPAGDGGHGAGRVPRERGLARDRAGHDEHGAREAVLAHHRERVLEDVAVAVVERQRERGLAGRELSGRRSRRGRRRAARSPRSRPSGAGTHPGVTASGSRSADTRW